MNQRRLPVYLLCSHFNVVPTVSASTGGVTRPYCGVPREADGEWSLAWFRQARRESYPA